MGRIRFTPEQIIGKLREAEVLRGQGANIGHPIRHLIRLKSNIRAQKSPSRLSL